MSVVASAKTEAACGDLREKLAPPPAEIWRVEAATEGESNDLRKALPVLVAATIEHIGSDSHGQKTVRIKETKSGVSPSNQGL